MELSLSLSIRENFCVGGGWTSRPVTGFKPGVDYTQDHGQFRIEVFGLGFSLWVNIYSSGPSDPE